MADKTIGSTPPAQTVSQEITERLMRRIAEHYYPVESRLPTERELAAEFQVTRHVVREALKRLEAVGVVRIRQGSGIYVQDLQLTGGTELFRALLTHQDGSINLQFLQDVLEFRGHMFRTVIRLAAARRTDEELHEIKRLIGERAAAAGSPERLEIIHMRVFEVMAQATHNRMYQLIFNTLGHLSIKLGELIDLPLLGFEQTQQTLEQVVEALEYRDEEMADLLIARFLNAVRRSLAARQDLVRGPQT